MSEFQLQATATADKPVHTVASEITNDELRCEFDRYCRGLGALDVLDLFNAKIADGNAADLVESRFPGAITSILATAFRENPEWPTEPAVVSNWDRIVKFVKRYTLLNVHLLTDIYVPVFAASPVHGVPGNKFSIGMTRESDRSAGFEVHVFGIGGGFGYAHRLRSRTHADDRDVPIQLQTPISALLRTWGRGPAERLDTLCPIPYVGNVDRLRIVPEGARSYINVVKVRPELVKARDNEDAGDILEDTIIDEGTSDNFVVPISSPAIGLEASLKIRSTCRHEMFVRHTLPGKQRGNWFGESDGRCHDFVVVIEPIE